MKKSKGSRKRHGKAQTSRTLVTHRLENVSKTLFKNYYNLITDLIGRSPGIYALYDENELYYVGRSRDLKRRVKRHLSDRHFASWTHFSLFLVRKEAHINEIESLLVRIANPKGNKAKPKGRTSSAMLKILKKMVKKKQREEFDEMFEGKKPLRIKTRKTRSKKSLAGLVEKRTRLYRTYKGKEYTAYLYPDGTIKIGKRKFNTPTAAAKAVVRRRTVNGWRFWYIKDSGGNWVKLSEYKG